MSWNPTSQSSPKPRYNLENGQASKIWQYYFEMKRSNKCWHWKYSIILQNSQCTRTLDIEGTLVDKMGSLECFTWLWNIFSSLAKEILNRKTVLPMKHLRKFYKQCWNTTIHTWESPWTWLFMCGDYRKENPTKTLIGHP